jgi:subtilisin family serine protease
MSKIPLNLGIQETASAAALEESVAAAPETTGRYLVTFREDALEEGISQLSVAGGMRLASAADFRESAVEFASLGDADALVLPEIGAAVIATPDRISALGIAGTEESPFAAIEPERYVYAFASPAPAVPTPRDEAAAVGLELPAAASAYLRGYRDALESIVSKLGSSGAAAAAVITPEAFGETNFTWGLQATGVHVSTKTGLGIRVAVLDTGMDLRHPDFAGRSINSQSFVPGEAVQDGHGHGTHCIGTSCGPRTPGALPRYGVAYQAIIFAGKVLSNAGSGMDGWILAGMNWAVANGCPVVSMSLGARVAPGQPFSQVFENVGRNALTRGTLIVAAAGNDSNRAAGVFVPVSHPANCPSILAVAAIDSQFRIANFSNRAINPNGGAVDIAGPGVDVRSTWPMPTRYRTISGTSMATPHVAGIAALIAQTSAALRGAALWVRLTNTARNLVPIPVADDGWGLVQAP